MGIAQAIYWERGYIDLAKLVFSKTILNYQTKYCLVILKLNL